MLTCVANIGRNKMRCDKCKYWERNEQYQDETEVRSGVKECLKGKPFWECTEWRDEGNKFYRALKPEYAELKMFVQDGSDYSAKLLTKADFGCIHFEEIDK